MKNLLSSWAGLNAKMHTATPNACKTQTRLSRSQKKSPFNWLPLCKKLQRVIQNQFNCMSDPVSRAPLPAFFPQLIYFVKDVFGPVLSSCNAEAVSQDTEWRSVAHFTEGTHGTAVEAEPIWHSAPLLMYSPSSSPVLSAHVKQMAGSTILRERAALPTIRWLRWVTYCKSNTVMWEEPAETVTSIFSAIGVDQCSKPCDETKPTTMIS